MLHGTFLKIPSCCKPMRPRVAGSYHATASREAGRCLQGGWPLPAGGLAAACRGAGRCLQGGLAAAFREAGRCPRNHWRPRLPSLDFLPNFV